MTAIPVAWDEGRWTNPPVTARPDGTDLVVEAAEGSDYWQRTLYGFRHGSGHALLAPWDEAAAIEVTFRLSGFDHLYDQAGLMLWRDDTHWVKAGVEINDGVPHLGAVVTDGWSDWSLAPVPDWMGAAVTIRASRHADAVVIRARVEGGPWRTVRVARFGGAGSATATADARAATAAFAGPFTCAPTRAGLTVAFTAWRWTDPDRDLHTDPPTG